MTRAGLIALMMIVTVALAATMIAATWCADVMFAVTLAIVTGLAR